MTKIQYLAFIRLPTEKAHGLQIMKTCEALAEEGVDVELVVPGRLTHITEEPFAYYGVEKKFTITSLNTPDFVRFGPLGFFFSLVAFSEAGHFRKSFWNADIIFSRDALVLLQYVLLGRPLVYEAHNQPTFASRIVARHAKKLLVISEGLKKEYVKIGIVPEKITVIPDAADTELFRNSSTKDAARKLLGLPAEGKVALYVGRIDAEKGAETFAASSEFLPGEIRVVLVGYGLHKEEFQKKYPKAIFLAETAYKDLPKILPAGDVLVVPNSGRTLESAHLTSPLKLFAFMASGIPMVASDVPAIRDILPESAGTYVMPDDPKSLAKGIVDAIGSGSEKASEAKTIAERYSWGNRAKKILASL